MFRVSAVLLASWLALSACGNRMQSKEKVQEAIIKRLQTHSGLDLKTLDVTTTSVTFDKNMAYATVAFHPKGDPNVNGGLLMKYTLEDRNGNWEVVNVGDTRGGAMAGHAGTQGDLPPGHPQVGSPQSGLPPGHPQVGTQSPGAAQ